MTVNPNLPEGAKLLLDFIAKPESGGSYTVVYAHHENTLPQPITSMTINALIAAQGVWGKQWGSSAAGRYQFMPTTLISLKAPVGLTGSELFSPDLQDWLGYALLKHRGFLSFAAKSIDAVNFAKQLAEEWASIPVLAQTQGAHRIVNRGQSYYAGDGLNKALVTAEALEAVLGEVLALRLPTQPTTPLTVPTVKPAQSTPALNPLEQLQMNISLLTLIFHYLPLLPFLQQDLTFELKRMQSAEDGQAKLADTLVVLKDVIAQIEAATAGTAIPPSPTS